MKRPDAFMVCVRCITFNHAPYIVDALDGFTKQLTSFPFICTIVDDASTDGEQEIINHYLREHFDFDENKETEDFFLITARHKTNCNCWFAVYFLKYNHYSLKKNKKPYCKEWTECSKYEASCEGDDYWTDELKLQKQVDLMEDNSQMVMCFTANTRLYPNGESKDNRMFLEDCLSCSFEDYIVSEYDNIDTCTMLYKASLLAVFPEWFFKIGVGDIPSKLILFSKGAVGYINDITACYRKGSVSSWSVRMGRSSKMRWNNHKRILRMWNDFDNWTDKAYHKAIQRKIFILRERYIKRELLAILQVIKSYLKGD